MQAMATWLKWDRREMRAMERCCGLSKRSDVEGKIRLWYRLWETESSQGEISDLYIWSITDSIRYKTLKRGNIYIYIYLTFSMAGLLFFVWWWVFLGGILFSTSASPQDRQGQVYGSGQQALPSLKTHTHTHTHKKTNRDSLTDRQANTQTHVRAGTQKRGKPIER